MEKEYKDLKRELVTTRLQQRILFRCLHDIQSPVNAVSGYLELMELCLNDDKDPFKIERYRTKIAEGMDQISSVLGQIRYSYGSEADQQSMGVPIEVDLIWFLQNLSKNAATLAGKKEQSIRVNLEGKNLHIKTDLFLLQLFIYSILINMLRYASKKSEIMITDATEDGRITICFECKSMERSPDLILDAILDRDSEVITDSNTAFSRFHSGEAALNLLNGNLIATEPEAGAIKLEFTLPESV